MVSDIEQYPTSVGDVTPDHWNFLLDHALEKAHDWIVRYNSSTVEYEGLNGSTGKRTYNDPDKTTVQQNCINAAQTAGGGTIYLKGMTKGSVTYNNTIVIWEFYQGMGEVYTNRGLVLVPILTSDPNTAGWGVAQMGLSWILNTAGVGTWKWWDGVATQTFGSGGGGGDAISIRGITVDTATPTNGQILKYNYALNKIVWAEDETAAGGQVATQAPRFVVEVVGSSPIYRGRKRGGTTPYSSDDIADLVQDIANGENGNCAIEFPDEILNAYSQCHLSVTSPRTNITLKGQGRSTIWRLGQNLTSIQDLIYMATTDYNQNRIRIKDMTFDGNGLTYTSQHIINFNGGDDWRVQDCNLVNAYQDAIHIVNGGTGPTMTFYGKIVGCFIKVAGRYGIYMYGNDNRIVNTDIESTGDSNCVVGAGGIQISDVHFCYAHYQYYAEHGTGNDRYSALEILAGNCDCSNIYLDRPNKNGLYIAAADAQINGGHIFEANFPNDSSANDDIYVASGVVRTGVLGMKLKGRTTYPANYGIHDLGDYSVYLGIKTATHAVGSYSISGANSKYPSTSNQWLG